MRANGTDLRKVNIIGLVVCLSLLGDLSLFAVLPTHHRDVGLTLINLGLVLSIHRLIRIPGNPLAGYLVDRWGRRKPLLLGMLFAFVSTASYGLVYGMIPLLVSRIFWGIAWMFINISALSMVIDLSQPGTRGAFTGRMTAWYMIGLAAGPILGGLLVDLLGFQAAMLVCSVLTALGFFIAFRFIPDTRQQNGGTAALRPAFFNGTLWANLRRLPAQVWMIFLLFLLVQFTGEGIILSTLSLKLQQVLQAKGNFLPGILGMATAGGLLLGFRAISSAITTPFLSGLSDTRLGRRGVVTGSILLALAGFMLLARSSSIITLLPGVILTACGSGAVSAVIAAWLGDLVTQDQRGFAMGFYSTFGDIGSTLGPALAYALLASSGLGTIYLLCAGLFAFGLLILWLPKMVIVLKKKQKPAKMNF